MDHTTTPIIGLVDRLENLGYVQRTTAAHSSQESSRKYYRKRPYLVEKIRQDIVDSLRQIPERLTTEKQATWLQICERIHTYCGYKNEPEK